MNGFKIINFHFKNLPIVGGGGADGGTFFIKNNTAIMFVKGEMNIFEIFSNFVFEAQQFNKI